MKTCKPGNRLGIGVILILAGAIILAGNFGLIPHHIKHVLISWPMILIAIGLINAIKKEFTASIVLLAVGSYFMIPKVFPDWTFHYNINFWSMWPILLIIAGIAFVSHRNKHTKHPRVTSNISSEGMIDEVAIFGGRVTKVESTDFKGGEVTCVFGGCELHLEQAKMIEDVVMLDVTAIFGGMKLIVPKDWNVKVEVVSVFGGFSDKRMFAVDPTVNSKTLIIKGTTVFGGGELSNV